VTRFVGGWTDDESKLLRADAHLDPTAEESRAAQVKQTLTYRQMQAERKIGDV
jgi:hypothetical protein